MEAGRREERKGQGSRREREREGGKGRTRGK